MSTKYFQNLPLSAFLFCTRGNLYDGDGTGQVKMNRKIKKSKDDI